MVDEKQINIQHGTWVSISAKTMPNIKTYWVWLLATISISIYIAYANTADDQLFEKYMLIGQIARSEPSRLLSYMFVHANLLHLVLNMFAYLQLARFAELLYGQWRFHVIYLASGIIAGVTSVMWNINVNTVGASGAILGIMGSLLAYTIVLDRYLPTDLKKQMKKDIWITLALTILLGISIPNIDNAAHLGGFAGGFILGLLLVPREHETHLLHRICMLLTILIVIVYSFYAVNYKYAENQYKYEKYTKVIFKKIWGMEKNVVSNYKSLISIADELEYNDWHTKYTANVLDPLKEIEDQLKELSTPIDQKSKPEYELLKRYIDLKRKEADTVAIWIKTRDLKMLEQMEDFNKKNEEIKKMLSELNKK